MEEGAGQLTSLHDFPSGVNFIMASPTCQSRGTVVCQAPVHPQIYIDPDCVESDDCAGLWSVVHGLWSMVCTVVGDLWSAEAVRLASPLKAENSDTWTACRASAPRCASFTAVCGPPTMSAARPAIFRRVRDGVRSPTLQSLSDGSSTSLNSQKPVSPP